MRTWYVPLEILDDNRLVAQHRELHTVFGSVQSTRRGFQNHPVVKLYLGEHLQCAIDYHAYTLREMRARSWTGHTTPTSEALASVAATRAGTATCSNWQEHVNRIVPATGPYSVDADMHDLVERWTKEGKKLRNTLAYESVGTHRALCEDNACRNRVYSLLLDFYERLPGTHVTGNSSLRNAA